MFGALGFFGHDSPIRAVPSRSRSRPRQGPHIDHGHSYPIRALRRFPAQSRSLRPSTARRRQFLETTRLTPIQVKTCRREVIRVTRRLWIKSRRLPDPSVSSPACYRIRAGLPQKRAGRRWHHLSWVKVITTRIGQGSDHAESSPCRPLASSDSWTNRWLGSKSGAKSRPDVNAVGTDSVTSVWCHSGLPLGP